MVQRSWVTCEKNVLIIKEGSNFTKTCKHVCSFCVTYTVNLLSFPLSFLQSYLDKCFKRDSNWITKIPANGTVFGYSLFWKHLFIFTKSAAVAVSTMLQLFLRIKWPHWQSEQLHPSPPHCSTDVSVKRCLYRLYLFAQGQDIKQCFTIKKSAYTVLLFKYSNRWERKKHRLWFRSYSKHWFY